MPKENSWIGLGVKLAFVIALICCAVLGIQVLHNDIYVKAGIATLRVVTVIYGFRDHLLANNLSTTVQLHRHPSA
jgi:hypothetical protein